MDYNSYRDTLKELDITGSQLIKIIDGHQNNQGYWKKKDKVPKHVEVILELLKKLSLEKRLVYIHEKQKL